MARLSTNLSTSLLIRMLVQSRLLNIVSLPSRLSSSAPPCTSPSLEFGCCSSVNPFPHVRPQQRLPPALLPPAGGLAPHRQAGGPHRRIRPRPFHSRTTGVVRYEPGGGDQQGGAGRGNWWGKGGPMCYSVTSSTTYDCDLRLACPILLHGWRLAGLPAIVQPPGVQPAVVRCRWWGPGEQRCGAPGPSGHAAVDSLQWRLQPGLNIREALLAGGFRADCRPAVRAAALCDQLQPTTPGRLPLLAAATDGA